MNQFQIHLPPPANWQDFQRLTAEIARARYRGETVQEYGRTGQSQNGVDVFAESTVEEKIGIQCKETKKGKLDKGIIEIEATKAKAFCPKLDHFILATTAPRDKNIQDIVTAINSAKTYPFRIKVEFWEDCVDQINRSALVINTCYAEFARNSGSISRQHHLNCLSIALNRDAFTIDFNYERNLDDFESAIEGTIALFRTGYLYDRWRQNLVLQTLPSQLMGDDPDYAKFLKKLEDQLYRIHRDYQKDKLKFTTDQHYLSNRIGHYNIQRAKLLEILNEELRKANQPEIAITYA